jgi:hypothetical protein
VSRAHAETDSLPFYRTFIWKSEEARENGEAWQYMLYTSTGFRYFVEGWSGEVGQWLTKDPDPDFTSIMTLADIRRTVGF